MRLIFICHSGSSLTFQPGFATDPKKADVEVPVLLMHSYKSVYGDTWTAEHNAGDGVLDVKDISKYGKRLGADVTEVGVADGLHDLILSRKDVRESVYRTIFEWLSTKKID
jgi:alpha-beta hydrolase superfamily lysophospholipase